MAMHVLRQSKRAAVGACASSAGVPQKQGPKSGLNAVKKVLCATGAVVLFACATNGNKDYLARMDFSAAAGNTPPRVAVGPPTMDAALRSLAISKKGPDP